MTFGSIRALLRAATHRVAVPHAPGITPSNAPFFAYSLYLAVRKDGIGTAYGSRSL